MILPASISLLRLRVFVQYITNCRYVSMSTLATMYFTSSLGVCVGSCGSGTALRGCRILATHGDSQRGLRILELREIKARHLNNVRHIKTEMRCGLDINLVLCLGSGSDGFLILTLFRRDLVLGFALGLGGCVGVCWLTWHLLGFPFRTVGSRPIRSYVACDP